MWFDKKWRYWGIALFLAIHMARSHYAWAEGAAPGAAKAGPDLSFLGLLAVLFGIIYFLVLRPQQKQAKERQAQISAIKKGDAVVTAGGIHGKVVGLTDTILTVEIADNCKIKVERVAIQAVNPTLNNGNAKDKDKDKDKEKNA